LREPEKLQELRTRLVRGRLSAPLFDTTRYTAHLESAYLSMHEAVARVTRQQ